MHSKSAAKETHAETGCGNLAFLSQNVVDYYPFASMTNFNNVTFLINFDKV